jgi:hypothetical protein
MSARYERNASSLCASEGRLPTAIARCRDGVLVHHGPSLSRHLSPVELLKTSLPEQLTGARAASLARASPLTRALPEASSPQRTYGMRGAKPIESACKSGGFATEGGRQRALVLHLRAAHPYPTY